MENRFMRRALLALTLVCTLTGCFAASRYFRKAAIYIAAPSVEAMQSPQERAAVDLFLNKFGNEGVVLTPADIDQIDKANFDMLWIPIDSTNVSHSTLNMRQAFTNDRFYQKVRQFHADGGNLYLTMFAIQLLTTDSPGEGGGLGLIPDYMGPNIVNADIAKENVHSVWGINAQIGARMGDQHYDRRNHPIYSGLTTMGSGQWEYQNADTDHDNLAWGDYTIFPMQGRRDRTGMDRFDHNCMWQLAPHTGDNAKVGIYVGYEGAHGYDGKTELQGARDVITNPQELAVVEYLLDENGWFHKNFPDVHVEIICPGDIDRIKDRNNFDVIWVHMDRNGIEKGIPGLFSTENGYEHLRENNFSDRFVTILKNYVKKGGELYLSKHATQLVSAIGRISEADAPNVFSSGNGGGGYDMWSVNAQIGYVSHGWGDADKFFRDRRSHPIYSYQPKGEKLVTNLDQKLNDDDHFETYSLLGNSDGLWREDHNCLWKLCDYKDGDADRYSGDGGITRVGRFEAANNAVVLGTWGQQTDWDVAGIVEFEPTTEYRGRIIANGLAAYEWRPRGADFDDKWHDGTNTAFHNLEILTYNILRYLATGRDIPFLSSGANNVVRFEQDANAVILGTWGQDADHSAAGIVEFKPANRAGAPARLGEIDTDPALSDMNKNKAAGGTILVNGMACTTTAPQFHNDYQANSDLLHTNSIDYLAPWHSEIVSGVEDVAVKDGGMVRVVGGELRWSGFDAPAEITLYGADGRVLRTLTVEGNGSCAIEARGLVIVSSPAGVVKAVI